VVGLERMVAKPTYTVTSEEASSLRIPANDWPGRVALTIRSDAHTVRRKPGLRSFQRVCVVRLRFMTTKVPKMRKC
jgi:hypothetical protein